MKNAIYKVSTMLLVAICVFVSVAALACLIVSVATEGGLSDSPEAVVGVIESAIAAAAAAMIVFQLKQSEDVASRESEIAESQFIMQYNQQFIENADISRVASELESVYLGNKKASELDVVGDRQSYVNYLIYLEGLAPLVLNKAVDLAHIDSLFGYRYFIAVNNPELQKVELGPYAGFYCGCYQIYHDWVLYRITHGLEIPLFGTALDSLDSFDSYAKGDRTVCDSISCSVLGEPGNRLLVENRNARENLKKVSSLIYDTNPSVYSAMFGDREAALAIMSDVLTNDSDRVFCADNCYVAAIDERVMGVVLWVRGLVDWDSDSLERIAARRGIDLPNSLSVAAESYFENSAFGSAANDVIILGVCTDASYRRLGIGEALLRSFIGMLEPGSKLRLCVSREDVATISLCRKMGFSVVEDSHGISLGEEESRRLRMMLIVH